MSIQLATKQDLADIVRLEEFFFHDAEHQPEIPEAYDLILDIGNVWIMREGEEAAGMLAVVPVQSIAENSKRVLDLPEYSPLRKRYNRGYFKDYDEFTFVNAFVSKKASGDLTRKFLKLKKAIGFVYEEDNKALEFYQRFFCKKSGKVQNVHSPTKFDYVLTYERAL